MYSRNKLDRYEVLETLGEGRFGRVFKARNKITNQLYAFKKMKTESVEEGIPGYAIREISLLKELKHPNVVKIMDVIYINRDPTLVIEYVDQDLHKFIESRMGNPLNPMDVKCLMYQLIRGIEYCHRMKILHRDLKPKNLLLSNEGILKIADFGLARGFGIPVKNCTNEVVTLWYRAPDILLGSQQYTGSIDMWSVGCIFAELVNMKPLFDGTNTTEQLIKIFKVLGTPNIADWPELVDLPGWKTQKFENYFGVSLYFAVPTIKGLGLDLLQKLLKLNPNERITAKKALEHPYFDDIPSGLRKLYEDNHC